MRSRTWHAGLVHAYPFQSLNGTLFCQGMMRNGHFLFVLSISRMFAEGIAWLVGALSGLKKDAWSKPRHQVCGPRCLNQPLKLLLLRDRVFNPPSAANQRYASRLAGTSSVI